MVAAAVVEAVVVEVVAIAEVEEVSGAIEADVEVTGAVEVAAVVSGVETGEAAEAAEVVL